MDADTTVWGASEVEGRRRWRWHWIEAEIAGLDPVRDADRVVLLSANRLLPPLGAATVFNLLYTLGFLRIAGQLEGALAVDRDGEGKVHRSPERRAEETVRHFSTWIGQGSRGESSRESLAQVRRAHSHYEGSYSFSEETYVHTIALFAVQFDELLARVGAPGYSEAERTAQVEQWREIGSQLGVEEMPESWAGMQAALEAYESSPGWYGPSEAGYRCAEAVIAQFGKRRLPPGLRWTARPLVASLVGEQVLWASGQKRASRPVVWAVRGALRAGLALWAWAPDRRALVDPAALVGE